MPLVTIEYEDAIPHFNQQFIDSINHNLIQYFSDSTHQIDDIGVFFCGDATMKTFNERFRKIDQTTDVLSWNDSFFDADQKEIKQGSIAISYHYCLKRASEYHLDSYKTEFIRLLVHGIVHLLDFDHQTQQEEQTMLSIEKKILTYFQLQSLY